MRIFRLRTLAGSNVAGLLLGGALFSQFFLLTLYMQQVLHYSAIKTGVAYVALTLAVDRLRDRLAGARARGSASAASCRSGSCSRPPAWSSTRGCPSHGHYFWDLFPAFLLSGVGLGLAFVPMTIGALTGVEQSDAGVASGLINTSQQIGGAIGVAAATTIATTFTSHYVTATPARRALGGAALTHGFQIAFYVLAGVAAARRRALRADHRVDAGRDRSGGHAGPGTRARGRLNSATRRALGPAPERAAPRAPGFGRALAARGRRGAQASRSAGLSGEPGPALDT